MRTLYVTAAFAALALFSCTKEMEVPTPQEEQQPEAEKVWTVTVEATRRAADVTKAVLTDDGWMEEEADAATKGLELDGNYLRSTWDFKEKVYVYFNRTLVGELESQRYGENSTVLAGSLTGSFPEGETLNLYLIGPADTRTYIGQKGTLEDISENFDYAKAQARIASIDAQTGAITLSPANFENLQSINEFSFGGSAKVKQLTISGAGIVGRSDTEAYVTVTPDVPGNKLYVAISNSLEGEKIPYEFIVEMEDGKVHSIRKKAALQNGKYYKASLNYNINTLYDAAKTPLTFEMLEKGLITIYNPKNLEIQWSVNGSDFVSSSDSEIQVDNLKLGDKVVFSGKNLIYGDGSDDPHPASCTRICLDMGKAYVYGNINSLRDPFFYYNTSANPALLKAGKTAYAYLFNRGSAGNQIWNHPYKDILLPATEVGESAYQGMFSNCINLTRAPELPATTLARSCYSSMFNGCANLKKAPELPAMQLAEYCYKLMFRNCYSLETAPELPAERLAGVSCYAEMFYNCTALKQITCLAKNPSSSFMGSWVTGVPSSGLFIQHPSAVWTSGVSGIPAGWGGQVPLTIEAIEDGTITISNPQRRTLRYSTAANLSIGDATSSSKEQIEIPVSAGDKLRLWGDNAAYGHEDGPVRCTNIIGSGLHYVYGDLCSLISSGGYTSITSLAPYAFASLFSGNDKLKSHPTEKLVIRPATVGDGCFRNMFSGCTALERAPELPATTLAPNCYEGMFYGCTALTQATALPATTLADFCYMGMFSGCTALQNPPAISATTLAMNSCMNMFSDCTSLKESPELKAQTLSQYCYSMMFSRCTSLKKITCTASNLSAENALMDWVDGVPSGAGGTFVKKSGVTWPSGSSGIPTGWTVQQQ